MQLPNSIAIRDFPVATDSVYLLGLEFNGEFVPFYVGQSSRILGRIADYQKANFSARTDFKVGVMVDYFKVNRKVKIAFKESSNPKDDERHWIEEARKEARSQGYIILNDLDLKTGDEDDARRTVLQTAAQFLRSLEKRASRGNRE